MANQDWFDKDFYAVLGVTKDVSAAELKKKYRALARQFHPDSNAGDAKAEARFKEISEAFAVLNDKESRAEYDQVRAMGSGARFTSGGGGSGGFEDVFGTMFGGGGGGRTSRANRSYSNADFENLFGSMFGGGAAPSGRGAGPMQGRDIAAATTIDFGTAIRGDTVSLQTGEGSSVKVRIPEGVADGQKIRLKGKGEPSLGGGAPGDLVLTVSVRPHPVFSRDGLNLRVDVPVTFVEAALGATIEVPTLGGSTVKLKVLPGTPSGRVLRVKGRGVTTTNGVGDLLATVMVAVPTHLPGESKQRLEEFAAAMPDENPRDELIAKARD